MNGSNESECQQCPVCGKPIMSVTVIGPTEAIVSPCGHVVDPTVLNRD